MDDFSVDEIVEFTSRDNKTYDVNFRGYYNELAVIVGKSSDKIGQMIVGIDQLKKKVKSFPTT